MRDRFCCYSKGCAIARRLIRTTRGNGHPKKSFDGLSKVLDALKLGRLTPFPSFRRGLSKPRDFLQKGHCSANSQFSTSYPFLEQLAGYGSKVPFSWKKGLTRIRLFSKSVLFWHICLNKSLVKVKNTCFSDFATKSTKERRGLTLGLLSIVPKGQKTPTIWRACFGPPKRSKNGASSGELRRKRMILYPS